MLIIINNKEELDNILLFRENLCYIKFQTLMQKINDIYYLPIFKA